MASSARKLIYELDDAGRFSGGRIFGPDGRLRFKSRYTYDSEGRLQEETQSAENDTVLHKIVYSYEQNGKQNGYSIFDASGKLLGPQGSSYFRAVAFTKIARKKFAVRYCSRGCRSFVVCSELATGTKEDYKNGRDRLHSKRRIINVAYPGL
jgi:hypothetical protein